MSQATDAPIGLSMPSRQPYNKPLDTIEDVDSLNSLTPQRTRNDSPLSPFYDHSAAPISQQLTKADSKQHLGVYESDIEACITETKSNILSAKKTANTDCTVWPGQKALKEAKRAEKRRRECWNPMRGLGARTKFWLKIAIAAVIVGIAVGVGFGITKAVHGGVWHDDS